MNTPKLETFTDRALWAAKMKFKRSVTLAEIGKWAGGITQPSVSEWNQKEDGGPKLANGIKLAKALDCCVEWLYTGRGAVWAGRPLDAGLARLLDAWPFIDDLLKGEILGMALENARGKEPPRKRPA